MHKVKLSGGVGNQLFQYFEGARRALENKEELLLDFREVYLGKSNHGSLITSFNLPVQAQIINLNPNFASILLNKCRVSFRHRISKLMTNQLVGMHHKQIKMQNSENYEFVTASVNTRITLKQSSPWFTTLSEQLRSQPSIAIHIRRGDYALPRNRNSIGVLDKSFYRECLVRLFDEKGILPIWVFSDSIEIEEEFKTVFPENTKYVVPPLGTDPAESMMLMSEAAAIIISNSTYSWWAACLSEESTIVYCPFPWFKNLEQPSGLLIDTWRPVKSTWKKYDA